MDVKIPKLSRKRFIKLMMSEGYDRNTSNRLLNVFKNMYSSKDYISFWCFITYLKGMRELGEKLVII